MPAMNASENFWKSRKAVAYWLLAVAGVILMMITIGGLTRLTGSGLSITEWKPIMGALPPMSDEASVSFGGCPSGTMVALMP